MLETEPTKVNNNMCNKNNAIPIAEFVINQNFWEHCEIRLAREMNVMIVLLSLPKIT